ncbi:MAG: hypothetical protein WKF73_08320 [Nocardioidaceae bacterium]
MTGHPLLLRDLPAWLATWAASAVTLRILVALICARDHGRRRVVGRSGDQRSARRCRRCARWPAAISSSYSLDGFALTGEAHRRGVRDDELFATSTRATAPSQQEVTTPSVVGVAKPSCWPLGAGDPRRRWRSSVKQNFIDAGLFAFVL